MSDEPRRAAPRPGGGVALAIAALVFALFALNVLLAFAQLHLGIAVAPLFGRVTEFVTLLAAALAFGIATLLRERGAAAANQQHRRRGES